MKRIILHIIVFGLSLSACLPAPSQPEAASPDPVSEADLQATAAVLSQQTLRALPTSTIPPSNTPVVNTISTSTATQDIPTETLNPVSLIFTATLTNQPGSMVTVTGTLPSPTPSQTINPLISATLAGTAHPQHYGTMPPYLPSGQITLINRSKVEVYISLQCTTKDGNISILETPVNGTTKLKAPAGKYTYVAWVGGRQLVGKFSLDKNGDVKIKIFKDRLEIGS